MRQFFPTCTEISDLSGLLAETMMPTDHSGPWVMANMVMSSDGSYSLSGRSGALSSPGDKAIFHTLRTLADVILVGAGTARTERYRRPEPNADVREIRRSRGQAEYPRLALVSGTGAFPADQPFLNGDGPDPLVYRPSETSDTATAPAGTVIADAGVELRTVAGTKVSPVDVVNDLGSDDISVILCEGGPNLLGQLCEAGLLNQLFVTLAPKIAGGSKTGLMGKTDELGLDLELITGLEDSGFLMLNYHVVNTVR